MCLTRRFVVGGALQKSILQSPTNKVFYLFLYFNLVQARLRSANALKNRFSFIALMLNTASMVYINAKFLFVYIQPGCVPFAALPNGLAAKLRQELEAGTQLGIEVGLLGLLGGLWLCSWLTACCCCCR